MKEIIKRPQGKWENIPLNVNNDEYGMNKYNMRIKCTVCGFVTARELRYAFCPNCGADTRGIENE